MKIQPLIKYSFFSLLSLGPSQITAALGLLTLTIKMVKDQAFKNYYNFALRHANPSLQPYFKERLICYSQAMKHNYKIEKLLYQACIPLIGIFVIRRKGMKGFRAIGKELASNFLLRDRIKRIICGITFPFNQRVLQQAWLDRMCCLKKNMQLNLPCSEVQIPTSDQRMIQGLWSRSSDPKAPAMLLFHGNAMTASAFESEAEEFKKLGFHVLAITMGGYPESSPHCETSEKTAYLDAHAAVTFVKKMTDLPNESIAAFGLSLGGSLALEAGSAYSGMAVITAQTFSKIGQIPASRSPKMVGALCKGFLAETFKKEKLVADRYTDGFNNIKKVASLTGPYFAIQASHDELMVDRNGQNLTQKLVQAYVKAQKQKGNELDPKNLFVECPGGHGLNVWHSAIGKQALLNFLQKAKFIK